ncbi:hypothetical protein GCM10007874_23300 [Labrys miyagiensis]|uniref:Uncharacterized protein n=1 Tax=Labrys miyagiensis TaxID=346912 RepID=A0ABQ6CHW7_9HYPH|nr:hypothetical protein GCM10007874_23300 [Labrys miyagiensis]
MAGTADVLVRLFLSPNRSASKSAGEDARGPSHNAYFSAGSGCFSHSR